MNVGVCKISLRLPENQSLKGKRRVISSLCSRVSNKFNVSIAEVADHDAWQIATLGIACVSNEAAHADEVLQAVVGHIEHNRDDLELVSHEQETITGF